MADIESNNNTTTPITPDETAAPQSILNRLDAWEGWRQRSPRAKSIIMDFLRSGDSEVYVPSLDNNFRRKVHAVAEDVGLVHTPDHATGVMHIRRPSGYDLDATIEKLLTTPWQTHLAEHTRKRYAQGHLTARERRLERHMQWVDRQRCSECGRNDGSLGYARNGAIMCYSCVQDDPVLCDLKFEGLDECY